MKQFILRFCLASLLAIAVAEAPVTLRAQTTPVNPTTPAGRNKLAKPVTPFHGNLKAIDNIAKTITVGNMTVQITSETIISKMGKPATLSDGAEGDPVAGAYRKDAEGKMIAVNLRFGPKPTPPPDSGQAKTNKTEKP